MRWIVVADWLGSRRATHFIIALGMVLRVAAIGFLARKPLVGDDILYHEFAMRILQGRSIFPLVPPAVGFYLAAVYHFCGNSPFVARVCMLPIACAFMYALSSVAGKFAGRRAANLITLTFAIYPLYILCSVEPLTETPAALLLLLSVLLMFVICESPKLRYCGLLGLTLGVLILTRPSALLMLVAIPSYVLLVSRKWFSSVLVGLVPTLMIAAWVMEVHNSTGHSVMINFSSSQNMFLGNDINTPLYRTWWFTSHAADGTRQPSEYQTISHLSWYDQNALYRRKALAAIAAEPGLFAIRSANRVRAYFAFDSYTGSLLLNLYHTDRWIAFSAILVDSSLYLLVALSSILFLFTVPRGSDRYFPTLAMAGVIFIYAVPYFFSVSHPIYHYPVVPLLGVFAGALWSDFLNQPLSIAELTRGRWKQQPALTVALLVFVYIQVEFAVVMYLFSSH